MAQDETSVQKMDKWPGAVRQRGNVKKKKKKKK